MDDWRDNSREYTIKVKAKTIDANPSFYTGVGIPEDKVFEGKEFVLEIGAGITIDVWIIG